MSRISHTLLIILPSYPVQLLAEAADKVAPAARVEAFSMMNMLNMVMGLVVVVALILGLAWVLKKYGRLPLNNQVEMKVLGGLSLGTRERAVLIQVEGKRLLLGVAPGRVATLHVMEDGDASFDQQLHHAMEKKS